MDRTILHCDFNYFYANVECLYHPEIRDKPVVVGGDEAQRHGIVLTKNPLAKRFGIQTGESLYSAKQKCPRLVVVPAQYDLYIHFSKLAHEIYKRYTDRIEPFGLDECWLDITGDCTHADGRRLADELRRIIRKELGITASVGVSWNKVFAKLGSDLKKPDATTAILRDTYKEQIWPLPASDLLYVGPATTKKLRGYGINSIGDLAAAPHDLLTRRFGKWGAYLWAFANGMDTSPVALFSHQSTIKSIGNSMTTWRDVETLEEAKQVFLALAESVCRRLRENGFRGRTVEMTVRDNQLCWFEAQTTLPVPSCTTKELVDAAMQLFQTRYRFTRPVRALGIRACNLVEMENGLQMSFYGNTVDQAKRESIESCVDRLRERYGRDAVRRASVLKADIVGEADPLTHDVHPISYFGR